MSTAAIALFAGLLAVAAGLGLYRRVLAAPAENRRANEIAEAIRTGANAFLRRQYRTVAMVGVPVFLWSASRSAGGRRRASPWAPSRARRRASSA